MCLNPLNISTTRWNVCQIPKLWLEPINALKHNSYTYNSPIRILGNKPVHFKCLHYCDPLIATTVGEYINLIILMNLSSIIKY